MENLSIGCIRQCGKIAIRRGLCISHYQMLANQVQAKKATWAELEAQGKCTAARKRQGVRWLSQEEFQRQR